MGLSVWQIALVALIFILLFGRGKIPALMTDLASGIKNFKHGIKDDAEPSSSPPNNLDANITAEKSKQDN
ncbi:twin-arginine translocase TatA/TatE family subunit [Alteromonas oceanisediminis]|uniref:twin-arginine translocase TatA/TatE family subunit n=1 Tax=Alteromonas oceanisediminis TaxID=2836180 RepID=UPI001BDADD01|nr:twin-arginine translocase TatA/TatE family subunit [Alteromonas oceanisediminis]MBT0587583.1 twin-arginine translocase TatA/TatE family subunit [Alteromonas oceanisediminis]